MNVNSIGGSSAIFDSAIDDSSTAVPGKPESVVDNDTGSQQLAQNENTIPNRWSIPNHRFSGSFGWQNSLTTPFEGTADSDFRSLDSNSDGVLDPSEKLRHYDNNMDGQLNQEDDLNGDGFVNPWEDHMS